MTQGNPLYPNIFNVVVDAVVRHWVAVVVEREDGPEGRRREGKHQSALLYVEAAEEAADATGGTEEEGMEEERDTGTEKDLTKWKKVVYLVRASFG